MRGIILQCHQKRTVRTSLVLNLTTDRTIPKGFMNANWSGETKNEVKVLPFIGGGWAEEFWDLDESKLESSNPADIAGEGRAGGGVCRQALNHTYTVSTHHRHTERTCKASQCRHAVFHQCALHKACRKQRITTLSANMKVLFDTTLKPHS